MRSRRAILGLASDDAYLQSLIPFESTPETARLSQFANNRASRTPAGKRHTTEGSLPVSLTEQLLDRLQREGNDAFKAGDLPRAIRLWSEALSKAGELQAPSPKKLQASRSAQLLANRCQAHLSSGDTVSALSDSEAAVTAAPQWPKAYYRKGSVLMRMQDPAAAYTVFQLGLELDAENPELTKACQSARNLIEAAAGASEMAPVLPKAPEPAGPAAADGKDGGSGGSDGQGSSSASGPTAQGEALAPLTATASDSSTQAEDEEERYRRPSSSQTETPPSESSRVESSASRPREQAAPAAAVGGAAGNGAPTPTLPTPDISLDADPESKGAYLLVIRLPKVVKSSQVDLEVSEDVVEVEVPGVYARISVPLSAPCDDDEAEARWDKVRKVLKVHLPPKKRA